MDIKAMTLPRMTAFQFSGRFGGKMSVGYGGSLTARAVAVRTKPEICTADELHYVAVPKSDWKLALWRYLPPPQAQLRNHPLLLLSGVATNAIGYDLSPEASFARYMSSKGFDTWILEVRGAGLSAYGLDPMEDSVDSSEVATASDKSPSKVSDGIGILFDRFSDLFGEERFRYLSQRLIQTVEEESQRLVDFQEHLSSTLKVFLEQIQSTVNYDWDFDHYLEDDIPAAFEYIRTESKPKDGKLLAIGHSMGGILLYALLSSSCSQGKEHGLKSVVTLASSLDYTSSRSSLKLLLPVADPVKALNVPAIPVGAMIAAAHPFASYPPYILSWLRSQISSPGMLHPKLLRRLVTCNFCTIPSKLLLQLSTVFQEGGLRDRKGNFVYKHHMHQSNVPILAVAGDQDLICPPEAVYETVKVIPKDLVSYRVFGEIRGPHFAHYDLVGGLWAVNQVYPCIVEFLSQHDR